MDVSRRRLLRVGGVTIAGAVAGCTSSGGSAPSAGGGTTTSESGDGLALSTLSVEGSPGGKIVVEPAGKVALLDFFATWCAPCKPQMKHLREIHSQFPEVHLLSITSERDDAAVRSFWKEYRGTWPVAQDPNLKATTKYEAGQLPTLLVLDREGQEVWRHVGLAAADTIAEKLREAGAG